MRNDRSHDVLILPLGLPGALTIPGNARGLVAFAHGSGSSRFSPRNTAVAKALNDRRFATLLFHLLTPQEQDNRSNVFNVLMLGDRLVAAVNWLQSRGPAIANLPVGLFGASTGAAAALIAAAQLPDRIAAVVGPWPSDARDEISARRNQA